MDVLIVGDIKTGGNDNIFGFELLKSLKSHPVISHVEHGSGWLFEKEYGDYDIILFQWPEMIFGWTEPIEYDLNRLEKALQYWKERSKIVVTIHNEFPHNRDTEKFRQLYEIVFSYANGFIHLGGNSKKILRKRYKKHLNKAAEIIVPHGNYSGIPNTITQQEARKRLGYSYSDNILFCMGVIRGKKELDLVLRPFKKAKKHENGIKLLIAGRLPVNTRKKINYYINRLPIWVDRDIQLVEKFIRQENIQLYANAADVFFIQRIDSLNSGNVPLGFTFGKVVVGPNVGVIGEELQKRGNPVFNPQDLDDVSNAILKAFKLHENGLGAKNKQYAKNELAWRKIGNSYVSFFKELIVT